ncbi:MAG: hypothetical protein KJZ59_12600 [Pararhodobacter sp.]|nr:hypothetical protein [Pararhodobacter sp.]
MRLLLCLCLMLAAPASACEGPFRAGMAAFADADRTLTRTEETLYRGLGWANRDRVFARLEDRSAATTACDEVLRLRRELLAATRRIYHARAQFNLARALCTGENRRRAEANLEALDDTGAALATQAGFLADLAARCRPP